MEGIGIKMTVQMVLTHKTNIWQNDTFPKNIAFLHCKAAQKIVMAV